MRVLLFGTYDAAAHPRIGVLAEGLRACGVDVRECNVPLGLDTAARVAILRQPWRLPRLAARLVAGWVRLVRNGRLIRTDWAPDAVLVGYLGLFDVHLARMLFGCPVLLDHLVFAAGTASDRGVSGPVRQRVLTALDASALGRADVVIVDTAEHLDQIPPRWRDKGVVVPVGAPSAWFAARTLGRIEAAGPLRVVFFGLFTPLQGTPVIGQAIALLPAVPAIRITLVGSGQDYAATRAAAGSRKVTWLPWVPATELPALVAGHDVCLGIFGTTAKAANVVPNKVFQGAAAGCAVVTSATAPQRRVLGSAAVLVPPGDPGALAAALLRLATDRAELDRRRTACADLADRDFAPGQVVGPLVDRLLPAWPRKVAAP